MTINFKNINSSLGMRQIGALLRNDIELAIEQGEKVSLNFDGISVVSNSFADECFGKLLLRYDIGIIRKLIVITNANDFVKVVITNSLRQRHNLINA